MPCQDLAAYVALGAGVLALITMSWPLPPAHSKCPPQCPHKTAGDDLLEK